MSERATARRGKKATMTRRTRRLGIVVALLAGAGILAPGTADALPAGAPKIGMVCTPGTLSDTTRTFELAAGTGYVATPDGNSVFMWSYASGDAPDNGAFQSPGPTLCAKEGETVVVHLTNTLPEATSVVFPGQDSAVTGTGGAAGPLTREAPAGTGSVTYTFAASSPGTYLYESGSDVAKQVEMGLYGALVVRPSAGANLAYDAATPFDPSREYLLLLSEIDPDLHHAVETGGTYDVNALHNRYFAINGREFPDTVQDNSSALLPTQPYGALVRIQPNTASNTRPALVRMVNAGLDNHPFHPHGNHTTQIAQDGRRLLNPAGSAAASSEHFAETVGSGQTQDFLLRWDDSDGWNPTSNPLPVQQPNYRDLTFKDGNTYYGGNPYLGYKGTLPTGTVSQNVCGEWYFPWHSHALNEFTNFDQGFGGMGTLLRVDPPGGCFTFPTSTTINTGGGTLRSGTYAALAVDDSTYYQVNSTTTGTARTTDWYAGFSGIQAGSANLTVTYRGRNCATTSIAPACTSVGSLPTTLYVWKWTAPTAWVPLGAATDVGPADTTITRPVTVPASNVIGTGSNAGKVRVRVLTAGGATSFVTQADLMKIVYDAP
jgi:FtsP/CotA-like multicopper oxidase with cupredoxin domain